MDENLFKVKDWVVFKMSDGNVYLVFKTITEIDSGGMQHYCVCRKYIATNKMAGTCWERESKLIKINIIELELSYRTKKERKKGVK